MIPFFDSTGMIYMHWVPTGQTVNKEYYVEVLMEFRKRFRRKRPALFKSGQWHFHQDNSSLSQTICPRWASTQFVTLPIVQTLLPMTFGYSLSTRKNLEAVVLRQLRSLQKVVGTVQQVHCSRRRLRRRGLEFHVCTINKSAHTKKVWKLFNDSRIYIYIYICVCVCVCVCVCDVLVVIRS